MPRVLRGMRSRDMRVVPGAALRGSAWGLGDRAARRAGRPQCVKGEPRGNQLTAVAAGDAGSDDVAAGVKSAGSRDLAMSKG